MESPCEYDIEPPGSISHGISYLVTGKRPLGRPRRGWEENIGIDLEEIGISAGNWVDSAQDKNYWRALVNAALILRVPYAMGLVS